MLNLGYSVEQDIEVEEDDVMLDVVGSVGRTRAERRKRDFSKALRKKAIDTFLAKRARLSSAHYPHLHQYSKNKQHCAVVLDTGRTNNRSGWGRVVTPSISDIRKSNVLDGSFREDYLYGEAV